MTRRINRRHFVRTSVAALFLGSPLAITAGEGTTLLGVLGKPRNTADLMVLAHRRMKEQVKPGIVILIPDEEGPRRTLAARLSLLFTRGVPPGPNQGKPAGQVPALDLEQLFCQAVFVCLPAGDARKRFPGAVPGAAVLLLDPAGRLVTSLPDGPALFEQNFGRAMTDLLNGPQGSRLAATAQAQREALGRDLDEVEAAVKDLDNDRFRKREAASKLLAGTANRIPAILAEAHLKAPSLEARRRLERLLEGVANAVAHRPEATTPVGVVWEMQPEEEGNIRPVSTAPPGRGGRVLRFVTEKRP